MLILLITLASAIPLVYMVILLSPKKSLDLMKSPKDQIPFVSIIISARNEAYNIQPLCHSLKQLSYPNARFEILVGDDDSYDDTCSLLQRHKPDNAHIIPFATSETGQFGKLQVLKKLTQIAKGDYFLFTDADMIFPKDWIQGMLHTTTSMPTMVLGITRVRHVNGFGILQDMDWSINQSLVSWVNDFIRPITAWGNNMMIDRATYEGIVGYENMENTVVEDVALMRQLIADGGRVLINSTRQSMAWTNPQPKFSLLIQQRLRWLRAIDKQSWYLYLVLMIRLSFFPCVLVLLLFSPWWLILIPFKALLNYYLLVRIQSQPSNIRQICYLFFFEFYEFIVYLVTFVGSLMSGKIVWKGRKY